MPVHLPRRRYLIDKLQHRFLWFNIAYFCAYSLALAGAMFIPLLYSLRGGEIETLAGQRAAEEFLALHGRFWPAILILFAFCCIHSVRFSHRIAGPLHRFREAFAAIAEGRSPEKIHLRPRDYLQQEATAINLMVDGLQESQNQVQVQLDKLREEVRALHDDVQSGEARDLAERLVRLEEQLDQFGSLTGCEANTPAQTREQAGKKAAAQPVGG